MAKITVIHRSESLDYIVKGSKIHFEKDKTNSFDSYAIKAIFNGNDIGHISAGSATSAPGTVFNKDIYNNVGDTFEGNSGRPLRIDKENNKSCFNC